MKKDNLKETEVKKVPQFPNSQMKETKNKDSGRFNIPKLYPEYTEKIKM